MKTAHTVLLVDDDPTLSAVFTAVLRKGGYTVLTAANANEAIKLLQANTITAIVTDLHMPKMDGAKMLEKIHAAGSTIPTILVTGSGELEDTHTDAPGISAVLIKPIKNDVLLATLEHVLAAQK